MAALYPIHPTPCGVLRVVTYRCAMFHRPATALAALALLAVPASAHAAPVLDPLKPCYVAVRVDTQTGDYITEDVPLKGSGFTPGALVNITVDGTTAATNIPVDGAGALDVTIKAPFQDRGERPFSVTVTEQDNAAQTITAQTMVTHLEVDAKPKKARPARRITLTGRGFTMLDRPVYAHYVRGRKARRTVRLARRPSGPCGTFKAKRRQFPFKPRTGTWIVQFDQQKRYESPPATAFVALKIFVKRVLRTQ
jgi:hypothetical protein